MLLLAVACGGSVDPQRSRDDSPVVARFGRSSLSVAEVDRHILTLPVSSRPAAGEDLDEWLRATIRSLVVELELLRQAEEEGLARQESFRSAETEARKHVLVRRCLAALRPDVEEVTEDQVRAAYDAAVERLAAPQRRLAYHLFRRFGMGGDAPARRDIERIRERVLKGESFPRVASEESDSESRHKQGLIGWVVPGELPAGFDRVIFSLPEGIPSEIVETKDGLQIFFVDQILPARTPTYEEARGPLRTRLVSERRESALADLEAAVQAPKDAVLLSRDQFATLVATGDTSATVLEVGAFVLSLGDLQRRVRQSLARADAAERAKPEAQASWVLLEGLRRRELLAEYCGGRVASEQLEADMAKWREGALLATERQRRLIEIARANDHRLRDFFDSNINRFQTLPTWKLRRLRVDLGAEPTATMARLEAAATANQGLDGLQQEVGGTLDVFETLGPDQVKELHPNLLSLVAPLEPGSVVPPYRTRAGLEIFEVLERRGSSTPKYAEIIDRVAAVYAQLYAADLYRELSDTVLAQGTLEISDAGLTALRTGAVQGEVSVEAIEGLLDDLASP